jgi:hypothetical protein
MPLDHDSRILGDSHGETPEDIAILVRASAETLTNAAAAQSFVTVQEISDAMNASDWRKLERAVVEYRAAHQK